MDINKLEYSQDGKSIALNIGISEGDKYSTSDITKIAIQDINNYTLSFPSDMAFIITSTSPDKYKITNTKKYISNILLSDISSAGVVDSKLFIVHVLTTVNSFPELNTYLCYSKAGINKQIVAEAGKINTISFNKSKILDISMKNIAFDSFVSSNNTAKAVDFWKRYIIQYNDL